MCVCLNIFWCVNIGVTQDEKLPQSYLDENLLVCQQRITLGGYRLAYLVEYMFPARAVAFLQ